MAGIVAGDDHQPEAGLDESPGCGVGFPSDSGMDWKEASELDPFFAVESRREQRERRQKLRQERARHILITLIILACLVIVAFIVLFVLRIVWGGF